MWTRIDRTDYSYWYRFEADGDVGICIFEFRLKAEPEYAALVKNGLHLDLDNTVFDRGGFASFDEALAAARAAIEALEKGSV